MIIQHGENMVGRIMDWLILYQLLISWMYAIDYYSDNDIDFEFIKKIIKDADEQDDIELLIKYGIKKLKELLKK